MKEDTNNSNEVGKVCIVDRGLYISVVLQNNCDSLILEDSFISIVERPKHIVFNLAYVDKMNAQLILSLKAIIQQIESLGMSVYFVFACDSLDQYLEIDPVGKDFKVRPNLISILEEINENATKNDVDVSFIKSFVNATVRTVFVQAKTLAKRESLGMIDKEKNLLKGDISGVVNVEATQYPYVILLSFPSSTFINLINIMTGESYTEITDDIADGAKELMNIIYGQASLSLNKKEDFRPNPPEMIRGTVFPGNESIDVVTKVTTSLESGVMMSAVFTSKVGAFSLCFWFPDARVAQALIHS